MHVMHVMSFFLFPQQKNIFLILIRRPALGKGIYIIYIIYYIDGEATIVLQRRTRNSNHWSHFLVGVPRGSTT